MTGWWCTATTSASPTTAGTAGRPGERVGALPIERRREVWERLATDLRPPRLDDLATDEVTLDAVPATPSQIEAGGAWAGRWSG
ncbi:hypothetical protein [Modestobacter sp. URMC 112]